MFMYRPKEPKPIYSAPIYLATKKQDPNIKAKSMAKLQLGQKRRLVIYIQDNKYYIEHAAAFALNLTNIRAIMTEKPRLIEIGIETLNRLRNNESIEIEYRKLCNDKEKHENKVNLLELLDNLEEGNYGIGVHGIDTGSIEEKQLKADSIISNGLDLNNNSKTILSASISLGSNDDMQSMSQDIKNYKFGNGAKVNIVIAIPLYIQNRNGNKIFLGFPERNTITSGQQYEEHCILDRICSKLKKIPQQFILGYYYENPNGEEIFVRNTNHYSIISSEERVDLCQVFRHKFPNKFYRI